eukprot:g15821.t1
MDNSRLSYPVQSVWRQKAAQVVQGLFVGGILGATMAVSRRVISGGPLHGLRQEAMAGGAFMGCILGPEALRLNIPLGLRWQWRYDEIMTADEERLSPFLARLRRSIRCVRRNDPRLRGISQAPLEPHANAVLQARKPAAIDLVAQMAKAQFGSSSGRNKSDFWLTVFGRGGGELTVVPLETLLGEKVFFGNMYEERLEFWRSAIQDIEGEMMAAAEDEDEDEEDDGVRETKMSASSSNGGHAGRPTIQITKKKRFFDGYADIANTSRKSIVLPTHDSQLRFDWELGDLKTIRSVKGGAEVATDREPVTIYDPKDLAEHGIAVNARLLTMNGIDTSILTKSQVEELLRQRPLTLRFATKKILKPNAATRREREREQGQRSGYNANYNSSGGNWGKNQWQPRADDKGSWKTKGGGNAGRNDDGKTKGSGAEVGDASKGGNASAPGQKNEMSLQTALPPGHKHAYAGIKDTDEQRAARRRRFEAPGADASKLMATSTAAAPSAAEQPASSNADDEDSEDEEEVVTIGPVTGKSYALEKSYLRLTSEAKASDVRPIHVLKEAFARLKGGNNGGSNYSATMEGKSWNYVSDQLRAIRQDLLVQNLNETDFAFEVYSANGLWALNERDLGQFHQCAMQLKSMGATTSTASGTSSSSRASVEREFRILRAVYNAFMGLDHIQADLLHPETDDPGIVQLVDAFRLKMFPKFFRLRKKCTGPLGDLCSCFDNLFRCECLLRFLSCFKIEQPSAEVLAWYLGEEEAELDRFLTETARLKNWRAVKKAADLAEQIKNSVAMNIRHQMNTSSCSSLGPANLGIVADFTRQKVTQPILQKLLQYASEHCQLQTKILQMHSGEIMNATEGRKVLHTALRIPAPPASTTSTSSSSGSTSTGAAAGKMKINSSSFYDPEVASEVLRVRAEIKEFAEQVRGGHWLGCTGRKLQNVLSIGIGGSYLGVEFVLEALRTEEGAAKAAVGRKTQFLANVDPIDIKRAVEGFDPESTLVVICSKTFTTAETILNAESVKKWLLDALRPRAAAHHGVQLQLAGGEDPEGKAKELALLEKAIISKHVVAVSTNKPLTEAFGIQKTFDFWDWVGGRFSVCSAVGLLPLSLQFGSEVVTEFLAGAHAMDEHFYSAPLHESLPVLLGLVQFWNRSFLDYSNCAVLPYCQALHRFTAHIQQLDMESNGKSVSVSNLTSASASKSGGNVNQSQPVDMHTGAIYFGEPGTNAQHSFYQLLHQGTTVVPCEFIGFTRSQNDVLLKEEGRELSNHDELMANFFAQPDALALGRSLADSENNPHKTFPGDRPSTLLLFNGKCDAWTVGLLLALYEHRTAVQGWLWGINSFDQYGVELGKVLAKKVTGRMKQFRGLAEKKCDATVAAGTDRLLGAYLQMTAN